MKDFMLKVSYFNPAKLLLPGLAVLALSGLLSPGALAAEKTAVLAGGCFWCMEEAFEKLEGVTRVLSGYSGGEVENPSYRQVVAGGTGHYEAVRIFYDDTQLSYDELLTAFWRNVDPFDDGGQFCDRGHSYKTAIFYLDEEQEAAARASLAALQQEVDDEIVTPLLAYENFYDAEVYHQNYYKRNPVRYNAYKYTCGRPARLKRLWGDEAS